jgi:inward rectifier potassium channel
MSISKSKKFQSDNTTGFGTSSNNNSGRFYTSSGKPNVKIRGIGLMDRISWFHTLINMKGWLFFCWLLISFIGINLIFTFLYYINGVEQLSGIRPGSPFSTFMEVFFFSAQTLTTVGYGRISPLGNLAGSLSTFEAFVGLLSFALASGLFFARFSKPNMHVQFSENMLVSPYLEGRALMFRFAPTKSNVISDVEVKLILAIKENENGKQANKFYNLQTTISKINTLVLSWTLVHVIDENSPLFGLSQSDFATTNFEVLIFVKAFDETHANQVMKRHSYISQEIVYGAKYVTMYHPSPNDAHTVLDFDLMNQIEAANVPVSNT